jgi:cytochrome c biogenesis protein CcmG, thiol:disulfide interchange protein DsbE
MNRCGSASLITNIVRCSRLSPRKVLRQDTVEIGKSSEYSPSNHLYPARPVSELHGGKLRLSRRMLIVWLWARPIKSDSLIKGSLIAMFLVFALVLYATLNEIEIDVGDSAPSFVVTSDDGTRVSSHDFGGKALLLNFWATWCESCQEEISSMDALARQMAPEGLVVLAISQDTDSSTYMRFISETHLAFLTVRQPEKNIQLNYGTTQIPETFLIDKKGTVRAKFISNQDWVSPEVIAKIRSVL